MTAAEDTIESLRARLAAAEQRDAIRRAALEMIAGSLTDVMTDQFQNWLASYAMPASGDNPTFPGMKRALVLPGVPVPPGAWVLPDGLRAQLDRDAEIFGVGYARIRRSEDDPEATVAERLPPSEVVVVRRSYAEKILERRIRDLAGADDEGARGGRISLVAALSEVRRAGGAAATRPCTCTGTCRGADGLGDGWRCAEGNDPIDALVARLGRVGAVVARSVVEEWTGAERSAAYTWASRTQIAAEGREVEVPEKPAHVARAVGAAMKMTEGQ